MIQKIKNEILQNQTISKESALWALQHSDRDTVYKLAHEISLQYSASSIEMCSIINAKSGKCSEDCKWCSQSKHYNTSVNIYPVISAEKAVLEAQELEKEGVSHFSFVISGKRPSKIELDKLCKNVKAVKKATKLTICASMGLLEKEELTQLSNAGVKRIHCNLETAPQLFKKYCTTHTLEDKVKTLKYAQEIGLEICCGGLIGMGETPEERLDLAFALKEINSLSIPINFLQAIPGTPLEEQKKLSIEEILDTFALFRLINPKARIRFGAGRSMLSQDAVKKAIYIAADSAIVGNLLTTIGTSIAQDKELFKQALLLKNK